MLILISPFSTVDAALKAGRLFVLALLAALSMVSPWIGALFSIGLIVVSYFIAGWSFRLMIFGTVYLWDLLTVRRRRFQPGAESNWMFTARQIGEAPVRTYGRLVHEPGKPLCFEFRPLLVMKRRNSVLPDGAWFVGRGLFYPELDRITGDTYTTMFILPPRYMTHEFAVARAYGCSTVRDVGVLKGLKAVWAWIRGFRGATRLDAKAPEDWCLSKGEDAVSSVHVFHLAPIGNRLIAGCQSAGAIPNPTAPKAGDVRDRVDTRGGELIMHRTC
jgi:hypothetical protein